MLPENMRAESFSRYPPQARNFAIAHLDVLKKTPPVLVPLILRQIIQYDWNFPAEREQLSQQLHYLERLDPGSFTALMSSFASLSLSNELLQIDWINHPQQFSEQLTADLWSQHQIDKYHKAAQDYQQQLEKAILAPNPITPRWTIVVVGKDTAHTDRQLFRRLMPHGTLFTQVDPTDGLKQLFDEVNARAKKYPLEYGHWYIDGSELYGSGKNGLTTMSYNALVPIAQREFALLQQFTSHANRTDLSNVEVVSSYIASLTPEKLGINGNLTDAPLRHFEVNILTQGAGCQIFSTTFVQWSARECLHRAQPLTLLARFGTRQSNAPMEQLMKRDPLIQTQDGEGSLIDAEMGAYYTWINQSRLPGAEDARFLVWYEDHNIACAIAPTLPQGKMSTQKITMKNILDWIR